VKTVQSLGDKIKELEELYTIKVEGSTMLESIQHHLERPLYREFLPKLNKIFCSHVAMVEAVKAVDDKVDKNTKIHDEFVNEVHGSFAS
jgi:hypothetical protein